MDFGRFLNGFWLILCGFLLSLCGFLQIFKWILVDFGWILVDLWVDLCICLSGFLLISCGLDTAFIYFLLIGHSFHGLFVDWTLLSLIVC